MAVPQSMSVEMTGRYHARRATLLAPRCNAYSTAYEIARAASSVGCESCGASKEAFTGSPPGFGKVLSARTNTKRGDAQIDGFSARLCRNRATSLRADCASCFCSLACSLVSSWGYFTFLQIKGIPAKGQIWFFLKNGVVVGCYSICFQVFMNLRPSMAAHGDSNRGGKRNDRNQS